MNIKHVITHTDKEFVKLPWKEQHKFGFWYKTPQLYLWDSSFMEKNIFDEWAKKHHPIQYFIRKVFNDISIQLYRAKRKARSIFYSIFKPYRNDVRKSIPRGEWSDINWLIETVNFAMMLSFEKEVEEFDFVDWNHFDEQRIFMEEFKEHLKYIKTERPALEENLYKDDHIDVEKMMNEKDTEVLVWMIKNRGFMWT
jgi:hypothetical protein